MNNNVTCNTPHDRVKLNVQINTAEHKDPKGPENLTYTKTEYEKTESKPVHYAQVHHENMPI